MRASRTASAALIAALALSGATPAHAAELRESYLITTAAATPRPVTEIAARVASAGGVVTEKLAHIGVVVAELPERAAAALARTPGLLVERDAPVELLGTQSSPPSWGLDRLDQRALPLSGTYTWPDAENGAAVDAYIVDTGVLVDHEQFTGRLDAGVNATTDGLSSSDCAQEGHGTHVAGTVGGSSVGVARGVTIVPVRVFSCAAGGASWSDIIRGLDWIIADHGSGPAVANLSLGGGAYSTGDLAIQRVIDDGVVVVVAAGNSGADACSYSPARAANAITVAASTSTDARASYSNYGSCVDIVAPGSAITSAYATGTNAYASLSGTSMAAPHVAGAAARYLQANPTATPAQTAAALLGAATAGAVTSLPAGTPNLLLHAEGTGFGTSPIAASAPAAPGSLRVVAGLGSLDASWTAPSTDGGSPVTGYTVTLRSSTGAVVRTLSLSPESRATTLTGLTAGAGYTVSVTAANAVGLSPATTSPVTVVLGPATAPQRVSVSFPGRQSARVSWSAPTTLGGAALVRYEVRWSTTDSTSTFGAWASAGTATSYTITGTPRGASRYVQVRAVTALGPGAESAALRFTQSK